MKQHQNAKHLQQGNTESSASHLPVTKAEDVEFSAELADEADLTALKRAQAADQRAEQS